MPDYGMVANSIRGLGDSINRYQQNRMGHEERMSTLGLQGTQLQFQKAQMEREQWLDEVVTGAQAIRENPNWDEATKASMEAAAPDPLKTMAFPRRYFADRLQTVMSEMDAKKERDERYKVEDEFKERELSLREKAYGLQGQRLQMASDNPKQNASDKKYENEAALQNLMGAWGIAGSPKEGFESDIYSPEEAEQIQLQAQDLGLNVYLDPIETEDTGSGWNPFDNQVNQGFMVRSIAPGKLGLAVPQRQRPQKPNEVAAEEPDEWAKKEIEQPQYQEGQTATGPNGQKIVFKGGAWVPLR